MSISMESSFEARTWRERGSAEEEDDVGSGGDGEEAGPPCATATS